MEFLPEEINEYALKHTSNEDELLKYVHRDTYTNVLIPRMLSGQLQGRFLSLISKMMAPKVILEIGTYTGYSALCLAEGLQIEGELHTIEKNDELEERIRYNISQSSFQSKIHLHVGDALQILSQLDISPDLVFIDADKSSYLHYYQLILPKMQSGGVIIADNVLWSGKVTNEKIRQIDQDTRVLHTFNTFVQQDESVENVLLPLRDGLMMVRKL